MHALLPVVFDLESEPPGPLGTYIRTDEDTVVYRRPAGDNGYAPYDCVKVVGVDLSPAHAPATGDATDDLERAAKRAAAAIIDERGWPWTLNEDGQLTGAGEKAVLMLMLAWAQGYGYGLQEASQLTDEALTKIIADLEGA
jgi:hypothetical protein